MSFATGLKTIVVATDLTAGQKQLWNMRANWREPMARGLCWLMALTRWIMPRWTRFRGEVLTELTEQARAALDELSGDLLREGIHSHSEIRQGAVAQMLVDVARQYEAGLIVIGTKGTQGAGPVWWAPLPSNWYGWRRARFWRWPRIGMPASSVPRREARCCWRWSATRRHRPRWPRPTRWPRPFSARCLCCMRADLPRLRPF